MRRRLGTLSLLTVLGLSIWGCGPPQVVPMTPPGVTYQRATSDTMEALGETQSRGTIQPANVAPEGPTSAARTPGTGPKPAEKVGPLR